MNLIYKLLKYINDFKAIKNNRVMKRVGWRVSGKLSGRLFGKLFR
jgi:hypothetical protein